MKKFISLGLILLASVSFVFANGDSETKGDKPLNLIVAHNQTSLENPYAYGIRAFKEKVEELSNGQITATLHHGTLGESESELVEKLQLGAASIVVASPAFMVSIGIPEVDMFSLNYLFDSFDNWEENVDGEFGSAMTSLINEKTSNGFKILDYWSTSIRDYYGKKPITKPEDLKGISIRTQSSQVQQEFWQACGAIPTSVAWGELYQALQQGVVDAAENDYTSLMLKEHHKTENGHYICETDHDYTTRLFLIDGNFYDSLTEEQQGWIDEASAYATEVERAKVFEMYKTSKEKVIADGAEVIEHKDIDVEAFKAIAYKIQDEFAQEYNMQKYLEMIRNTK